MKKTCDLHAHSIYSDGTWTPAELIREAERIGLGAVALTDHNTVDGLPEFLQAARGKDLEAVPGVEFSTEYLGMDIHLVGLEILPVHFPEVRDKMEEGRRRKEESNLELCENLKKAGYPVDYPAIRDASPRGMVNRSHIAGEMVRLGYAENRKILFDTLLDPRQGLYHPPVRPGILEMIAYVRSIGAVPVLAHPLLKLSEEQLRVLLPQAREAGLIGMETEYVTFTEAQVRLVRDLAKDYGLQESGGSDFHGDNKPGICLGVGRGNLAVPLTFWETLKKSAGIS